VVQQRLRLPAVAVIAVVLLLLWFVVQKSPRATSAPKVRANVPLVAEAFALTVENKVVPADSPHEGMVWIPGGEFSMGAQDAPDQGQVGRQATLDSRPIHRVYVDGFWMDKTQVTNRYSESTTTCELSVSV